MIQLKDQLKRPLRDVRISVIDRCNFRCQYCMPAEIFGTDFSFMKEEDLLSFSEIERLVKCFAELGAQKVRLTGGEPLLRKNLDVLVERLSKIEGISDIALTTNAIRLPKLADQLKKSGLQRVNISLDALDDEVFRKINGRSVATKPVLKGIEAALEAGLQVKINMVVKKGMNEDQIIPMATYFKSKGIPLRFIEFMDVGNSNGWNMNSVVTKREILDLLKQHFSIEPVEPSYVGEVSDRFRYTDCPSEVGVIASVTESFCSTCTRARISADGKLYMCLFASNGFDFKSLLGDGVSESELKEKIAQVWGNRSDRYSDQRTKETNLHRKKIEMSYIGG